MSAAYLITAGLGVPAMTFIGLWLLRLRRQRRQTLEPDSLLAEELMAELAANILQRALGQLGKHVAAARRRIVDELVDHQARVRRDIQRAFVEK